MSKKQQTDKDRYVAHMEAKLKALSRLLEEWEKLLPYQYWSMASTIIKNEIELK